MFPHRHHLAPRAPWFASLAGLWLLAGCGGGTGLPVASAPPEANARHAMEAAEAHHDSLAAAHVVVPEFADAAPLDKRLPPDVVEALKGTSEPWMFAWRVGVGTFRWDQLARTGVRTLPDDAATFDGNADGEDLRLTFLAMPGPNGTTALDPFGEWSLVQQGEIVHARRFSSPSVAYIDLANHERRQVLELSDRWARVDGALWIDGDRFVVFAAERFEPNPWSGGPVLYLVDVRKRTVTRYAGPASDYAGYQEVSRDLDRTFKKRLASIVFDGV